MSSDADKFRTQIEDERRMVERKGRTFIIAGPRELKIVAHAEAFRRAVALRLPFRIKDNIAVIGGAYDADHDSVYICKQSILRAVWINRVIADILVSKQGWVRPSDVRN